MPVVGVEQDEPAGAARRGQGVVDSHRARGVVADEDGGLDAELVEHSPELMEVAG